MDLFWFFWQMLFEWPVGTFVVLLLVGLAMSVVLIVVSLVFTAVDFILGKSQQGICYVAKTEFIAAHTRIILGGTIPIPQHVADSWKLTLERNGRFGTVEVSEEFYDNVSTGSNVSARFVVGGLTGGLYIEDVF